MKGTLIRHKGYRKNKNFQTCNSHCTFSKDLYLTQMQEFCCSHLDYDKASNDIIPTRYGCFTTCDALTEVADVIIVFIWCLIIGTDIAHTNYETSESPSCENPIMNFMAILAISLSLVLTIITYHAFHTYSDKLIISLIYSRLPYIPYI